MNYIRRYNEGLFNWRKKRGEKPLFRELSKDDLYLTKVDYEKRIGPSELKDSNKFKALHFPDMSMYLIKKHVVSDGDVGHETGVFGNFGRYSSNGPRFGGYDKVHSTKVWWDCGDVFVRLRKISDSLGYRLNTPVHVPHIQKDSKIVEIINFAFYKITDYKLSIGDYIDECLTLLYKVEGDSNWYQIGQIEKIEGTSEKNIVDEVIEENFLELIDEGIIEFTSEEISYKGKISYKCLVKVSKDMTPDILFKISECLLVASKRLNEMDVFIDIESMKHAEESATGQGTTDIVFTAIRK